jgi:hypothetical protein
MLQYTVVVVVGLVVIIIIIIIIIQYFNVIHSVPHFLQRFLIVPLNTLHSVQHGI